MTGSPLRIVLASASPRRAELLRSLGVEFEVLPSRAVEADAGHLSPAEVAMTNACRKALQVAEARRDALVVGADTVIALDGPLYGKPANLRHAARMLRALSGRTHDVVTGVCLCRRSAGDLELFAETTRVTMRRLLPRTIADYLRRVDVLDKAGAYAIQEHGDRIVRRISGSFSNVVGLPVERLRAALAARGIRSKAPVKAASAPARGPLS